MNENLKKYSFYELLNQGRVRIPKIQRDYAQGRESQKVNEVRKVFVHSLVGVVTGKQPAMELDFVYGSNQNDAFEPLDGQQRLTTLFLLHWMMGGQLNVLNDKNQSIFTYETRNTSKDFCDELVQHDAVQFVREAKRKTEEEHNKTEEDAQTKTKEHKETHKVFTPSNIIKCRDWFNWEWRRDPTILSMLVMIDAIYDEMNRVTGKRENVHNQACDDGGEWWDSKNLLKYRENLKKITFNLLNLGDFGLANELFVKMNARGKQLSDFDKLKSTLEEELQIQQKEKNKDGIPLATEEDEELWRTLMDGPWIDFFWHKYARQEIINTESIVSKDVKGKWLKAAQLSELQFKKLLLRLIALQLFEKESIPEELAEAAYNLEESKIDNLLFAYTDSLTDMRSDESYVVPSDSPTLNFKQLIEDINLLIYKGDNGIYYEISYLLPKISHIDKDDRSLFDSFLEINVPNDVELIFYAMLLFLRAFPEKKTKKSEHEQPWYFDKTFHVSWLKNLEMWVRSVRNIVLNDNTNQRIDKIHRFKEAVISLKEMSCDFIVYVNENKIDVETDKTAVRQFFKSLNKTYKGLDNQSLEEESQKAKLVLVDTEDWETPIETAEQHPYLWGQIRCLLNWSENKLDKFKEYSKRLIDLLDYIEDEEDSLTYYSAILTFVPDCWEKNENRLFQYNKDRDNSFKRYMREHTREGQKYGANIKALIDLWIESYTTMSIKDFLTTLIADRKLISVPWIRCIIEDPSILNEARNKRIYSQNGHAILAQRKTIDSHCFDPILIYLRNLCIAEGYDEKNYKLYDSKGEYEHAFLIEQEDHKYLVEWNGTEGHYSIKKDDAPESQDYTPEDMIDFMKNEVIHKI